MRFKSGKPDLVSLMTSLSAVDDRRPVRTTALEKEKSALYRYHAYNSS